LVAYKNVLKRFHPAFRHFVSLLWCGLFIWSERLPLHTCESTFQIVLTCKRMCAVLREVRSRPAHLARAPWRLHPFHCGKLHGGRDPRDWVRCVVCLSFGYVDCMSLQFTRWNVVYI
jgi:hypothetical protein